MVPSRPELTVSYCRKVHQHKCLSCQKLQFFYAHSNDFPRKLNLKFFRSTGYSFSINVLVALCTGKMLISCSIMRIVPPKGNLIRGITQTMHLCKSRLDITNLILITTLNFVQSNFRDVFYHAFNQQFSIYRTPFHDNILGKCPRFANFMSRRSQIVEVACFSSKTNLPCSKSTDCNSFVKILNAGLKTCRIIRDFPLLHFFLAIRN